MRVETTAAPAPSSSSLEAQAGLWSNLLSQSGSVMLGTLLRQGILYVTYILLARQLGATALGIFLLGLTVAQFAELLARLGLDRGVLHFAAIRWGQGDRRGTGRVLRPAMIAVLISGTVAMGLLMVLSEVVAVKVFHSAELTIPIRLFAVAVPLMSLSAVLLSSFQACQHIRSRVLIESYIQPLAALGLILLALSVGWGLWGAIAAYPVSFVVGLGVATLYCYRRLKLPPVLAGGQQGELAALLRYSTPLLVATALMFSIQWIDMWMVGYFLSPRDVGIYGVAVRTALLLGLILGAFNVAFAPMISTLHDQGDMQSLTTLYQTVARWSLTLTLPLFLVFALFGQQILGLFGPEFSKEAAPILVLLAFAWLVDAAVGSVGFLVMMSGRSRLTLFNLVVAGAVSLLLSLVLIPRYGLWGAASANAASIVCLNALGLLEVSWLMKIRPRLAGYAKPLAAAAIGVAAVMALRAAIPNLTAGVLIAVLIAVYGGCILVRLEAMDVMALSRLRTQMFGRA